MADNVTLNAGSGGDTTAADDIAGVKYQRVKLTLGADGVNNGDIATGNPMPVSGTVGNGPPAIAHDYVSLTQASTTDTYIRKSGGAAGSTVQTITVTFTDATKTVIANVAWT